MTIHQIPDVPVPAGATTDNCWSEPDCDGDMMRSLVWSRHDTDKIRGGRRLAGRNRRGHTLRVAV